MASILEYGYLAQDVYVEDSDGEFDEDGYYIPQHKMIKNCWIGLPYESSKRKELNNWLYTDEKAGKTRHDFFARLYAHRFTNETVIAFRGTVLSLHKLGDIQADIELTIKIDSAQNQDARDFFRMMLIYLAQQNDTNFSRFPTLVGHSLGGYLSQVIAVEYSAYNAVVFNAPGIGGFRDPYVGYIDSLNPSYKQRVNNYFLNTDQIHLVGKLK